ncbi:hypothetical protein SDC9_140880 [bioreactor metagenome]|uniref:Uncharacterized protein n=1 Tax=bioreactor metagenome TaxID=1076179 RepID=A0A645DX79_9ZZZZ
MEHRGENIVVQKGRNHRNLTGGNIHRFSGGIDAAALPGCHQSFLHQKLNRVPHGLPTHPISPGQLRFRGKFVTAGNAPAEQLLPQNSG